MSVIGARASETMRIIASDWRAFLTLAARAEDASTRLFFRLLAGRESLASDLLTHLAEASGADMDAYTPQPGSQASAAYVASLALNASPVDAVLALYDIFAAWGDYCASISESLRKNYGFTEAAVGFFDFFAAP